MSWNHGIGNAFVLESKNTKIESSVRFLLLTNSVNKTHYFQSENMIDFFKAKWTKWNFFTVFLIWAKYFFNGL